MLIVNPVSGRGLIKNYLLNIVSALGRGGRCVSVYVTEKRGDAEDFARQYGGDYDRLVCNGGDGTLSEVVNGIMALPEDRRPAVGYIPLGTTNDKWIERFKCIGWWWATIVMLMFAAEVIYFAWYFDAFKF